MHQDTLTSKAEIKFTLHALERMTEPTQEHISNMVRKYVKKALHLGYTFRSAGFNEYIKNKINPRKISEEEVLETINNGREVSVELEGNHCKSKFRHNDLVVIFNKKSHSVITAYRENNSLVSKHVSQWVKEALDFLGANAVEANNETEKKLNQPPTDV